MTSPLARPMLQSCWSMSCLSSTSRIKCTSTSDYLQRNRDDRQHERDQYHDCDDGVADPSIPVLAEVDRIVHQEQERHDRQRKCRAGESHRKHCHFDWVDAKHQRDGGQQNDDGVDKSKTRVLRWLEIFTPVPAEALGKEISNGERDLQRSAEACEQHAEREQVKPPAR